MALKGVKVNGTAYYFDYDYLTNKIVIDSALLSNSNNPVKNSVIYS